jgi:hypothetical protein
VQENGGKIGSKGLNGRDHEKLSVIVYGSYGNRAAFTQQHD